MNSPIQFIDETSPYTTCLLEQFDYVPDGIDTIEKLVREAGIDFGFGVLNALLERRLMQAPMIAMSSSLRAMEITAGIYAIFYRDKLVYIGSSDDVRGRMREHRRSVLNASSLNIDECFFRYLPCSKMAALSCEQHLIELHRPAWNRSGFGSKNSALFSQSEWNQKYGRTLPLLDNSLRLRESHSAK